MPPKKDVKLSSQEAVDRVVRARSRSASRPPPPMGRQDTPFGPVTLTDRGRGAGGMATTRASDFPSSTSASATDGSYREILKRARPETLDAVAAASSNASMRPKGTRKPVVVPPVADADQRRLAAHLVGIGRSEEQRASVAPKPFRAGLRAASATPDPSQRTEAFFDAFPQGAPAKEAVSRGQATGARAFEPVPSGAGVRRKRAIEAHAAAGREMSDSSGDES